jgi:uncharacterized membrane protein
LKSKRGLPWLATVILILTVLSVQRVSAGQGYSPKDLSIIVLRDGSVDLQYTVQLIQSSATIQLLGFDQSAVQSLLVKDGNNKTLSYLQNADTITISGGSGSFIVADYKSFKLTAKNGSAWTLRVNSPVSWSVTFPVNTTVTGFSTIPEAVQKGNPTYFIMPQGNQWLTYRLSYEEVRPSAGGSISPALFFLTAMGIVVGGSSLVIYRRYRWRLKGRRLIAKHETLNEEEKRILLFLAENRGKALETDVARALELPRTSAWRHVHNLEEEGLVVTEKFGSQNLVKLKR